MVACAIGTGILSRVFTMGYKIDDRGGFGLGEIEWSHIGRTGGSLSLSPPTIQNFLYHSILPKFLYLLDTFHHPLYLGLIDTGFR